MAAIRARTAASSQSPRRSALSLVTAARYWRSGASPWLGKRFGLRPGRVAGLPGVRRRWAVIHYSVRSITHRFGCTWKPRRARVSADDLELGPEDLGGPVDQTAGETLVGPDLPHPRMVKAGPQQWVLDTAKSKPSVSVTRNRLRPLTPLFIRQVRRIPAPVLPTTSSSTTWARRHDRSQTRSEHASPPASQLMEHRNRHPHQFLQTDDRPRPVIVRGPDGIRSIEAALEIGEFAPPPPTLRLVSDTASSA